MRAYMHVFRPKVNKNKARTKQNVTRADAVEQEFCVTPDSQAARGLLVERRRCLSWRRPVKTLSAAPSYSSHKKERKHWSEVAMIEKRWEMFFPCMRTFVACLADPPLSDINKASAPAAEDSAERLRQKRLDPLEGDGARCTHTRARINACSPAMTLVTREAAESAFPAFRADE